MSDTTHTTWLVPVLSGRAFFPQEELRTHVIGKLLRLEVADVNPQEIIDTLDAAGIHYHMWQEGHGGAYGPSVRVRFTETVEVDCNEGGGAVVQVLQDDDGAIRFYELSDVLTYLSLSRAFLKAYGVDKEIHWFNGCFREVGEGELIGL